MSESCVTTSGADVTNALFRALVFIVPALIVKLVMGRSATKQISDRLCDLIQWYTLLAIAVADSLLHMIPMGLKPYVGHAPACVGLTFLGCIVGVFLTTLISRILLAALSFSGAALFVGVIAGDTVGIWLVHLLVGVVHGR